MEWSRLVRYRINQRAVKYDELIRDNLDETDVADLAEADQLSVHVCDDHSAIEAVPTTRIELVKGLFRPFSIEGVTIIRCIGLNYKSHSEPWSIHAA